MRYIDLTRHMPEFIKNKDKLFKNIDDLIELYKRREQKFAVLNMYVKRIEERVTKLERRGK